MKEYRATIKVRNNLILTAIEQAGGVIGGKWCKANGLCYNTINHLINMTVSPITAHGDLSTQASRLCEVLGKLPEDLWTNEQIRPLERNFSELNLSRDEVALLMHEGETTYLLDDEVERDDQARMIEASLSKLPPRSAAVLRMRFGLGGEEPKTLKEIGTLYGVCSERIRGIEAKALCKLRHPGRHKLRELL